MEALAIIRLRQEAEKKQREEEAEMALSQGMSQEEIDALNLQFGYCFWNIAVLTIMFIDFLAYFRYPHPAVNVCAIGKVGSAAVWWSYSQDESGVIGWEIHRYRRSMNSKEWGHKGHLRVGVLSKKQVMLDNLTNGYEYRFGVRAINSEGVSAESKLSNIVVIEASLPNGWFRFFDEQKDKFYYANLKTQQSCWTRPDTDPDFLPEDIVLNFNEGELRSLRSMYDEEMHMFDKVTIERLAAILKVFLPF